MSKLRENYNYFIGSATLLCLEWSDTQSHGIVALFKRLNDMSYVVATYVEVSTAPFLSWAHAHFHTDIFDAVVVYRMLRAI